MDGIQMTPEEQAEMELWYVDIREQNFALMEAEWTAESYAQAAIDDHESEAYAA